MQITSLHQLPPLREKNERATDPHNVATETRSRSGEDDDHRRRGHTTLNPVPVYSY